MTNAHPGISPLDFHIHYDDPSMSSFSQKTRRVYELLYHRALASLAPHPVWEEIRRIGTVEDTVVAVGWTENRESGWTTLVGEELCPEPAIPSTSGQSPVQPLKGVMSVNLEQEHEELSTTDLLAIMKSEEIGRPSTYAHAIHRLAVVDHWVNVSPEGFVSLTEKGLDVLNLLENEQSLPQLDSGFTRTMEQELNAIERETLQPVDLLKTLDSIIDEEIIDQLEWLNDIGEPLAGEPAQMSYARRDLISIPVPFMSVCTEDPETVLADDDPLRSMRQQYLGAIIQATGRSYWKKAKEDRTALSVYIATVAMPASFDDKAFRRRLQYDALVRWVLGVTNGFSFEQIFTAKRWWETLDGNVQNRVLEIAETVIKTLFN